MKNKKKSTQWFTLLICLICLATLAGRANAQQLTDLLAGKDSAEETAKPDKVISIDHSRQNDKKIERRLQQIFSELDDLKGIKTTVSNGVVTLQGEVGSTAAEEKAVKFTGQMENVVEVKNKLEISHSLKKRIRNSLQKMVQIGEELIAALPLFLVAVLIVVGFWMLGKWFSQREGFYRRISVNYFIADLLGKLAYFFFIVIGIITALTLLDATALIGTFLGAAGIFGLAIGFAVKDTVENFITSLLLSLRNPFEVNDFVNIDGHEGTVARLTSRATILVSPDDNHIRIPNSTVFKAVIINYTRNPQRRFQFDVGIDTGQDLLMAQGLAINTLFEVPGVMKEPRPMALIETLGDSNVLLRIYGWVDQRNFALYKVRSEAIRFVKQAFDEANIVMPEPIYNLRISKGIQSVIEKTGMGEDLTKRAVIPEQTKHQTEEVTNVMADHSVENQIDKENAADESQNLLNPDAPSEM